MSDIVNMFLQQLNGPVTVEMIVLSLLCAFVVSLLIIFVYRLTFSGVVYNRTMVLTIMLLSMVTALIIRTINSNLSLSLGMVGALSIVRFRTAIKEPVDTAFMFWAITAGIMSGAGLYLIGIIGSIMLGVCYYIAYLISAKAKSKYLLVVIYNSDAEAAVNNVLSALSKKVLKSKSATAQRVTEITYEIDYGKNTDELIKTLQNTEGVRNVNIVTYNNDFGL